jgi:hypothetical protein
VVSVEMRDEDAVEEIWPDRNFPYFGRRVSAALDQHTPSGRFYQDADVGLRLVERLADAQETDFHALAPLDSFFMVCCTSYCWTPVPGTKYRGQNNELFAAYLRII